MVASIILSKKPDYGVIYDVKGKNLAIKFFLSQDNKQDKKVQKIQNRLIKLNRVDRRIDVNASQIMSIFILKNHSPRHRTWTSIATSRAETAEAAETMP